MPFIEQIVKESEHKMATFRIKGKPDFYNGEQRIRYSVMSVGPVSFGEESKAILENIKKNYD